MKPMLVKVGIITGLIAGIVAGAVIVFGGRALASRDKENAAREQAIQAEQQRAAIKVSHGKTCRNQLRMIDNAVESWALENNIRANAKPVWQNLQPYCPAGPFYCPEGGFYDFGTIDGQPSCTQPGHTLR